MVYLVSSSCGFCAEAKRKGLCNRNECVDISSAKGQKIAKEAGVKGIPEKVCKTKNGRYVKCKPTKSEKKKYGVG